MIHIGAQGWNYDGWKSAFFPREAKSDEYLSLYARIFDTVEIDSTFYATPPESTVSNWVARTPSNFVFSPKLPRKVTHENRLRDSADDVAYFCDWLRMLGSKLGLVLVQLPPDFTPSQFSVLERFLPTLPTDIRFAVEFRHRDWFAESTTALLDEHGVALTLVDSEVIPYELSIEYASRPTAQFSYIRWLGPRVLTDFSRIQIDKSRELTAWKLAIEELSRKSVSVFGYFNNHYQGHSPGSANLLKSMLGLPTNDPSILVRQPSLF